MSEKEINSLVENKILSIMKAVKDYPNNPEKASTYIKDNIINIFEAGKKFGNSQLVDELFG